MKNGFLSTILRYTRVVVTSGIIYKFLSLLLFSVSLAPASDPRRRKIVKRTFQRYLALSTGKLKFIRKLLQVADNGDKGEMPINWEKFIPFVLGKRDVV